MPIGDLARQDDYAIDPMTGLPIGAMPPPDSASLGDILSPTPVRRSLPVKHRTASPLVNITEQDIRDAMRMALTMRRSRMGALAAQDGYSQ